MSDQSLPSQKLEPGVINLRLIPADWPLTALGPNKDPYIKGWQTSPLGVSEVAREINKGDCKAIGVLGGPVFNLPYGLVWIDIDGSSVYNIVQELAGAPAEQALTDTLTICSGRPGRERRLYRVPRDKFEYFSRNKYSWYSEKEGEKLEVLWKRHQGVLMGAHPETKGYYTPDGLGFEWADKIPVAPDWLFDAVLNKNKKLGKAVNSTTRIVGPSFAINQHVDQDRENKKAIDALAFLPQEYIEDYSSWILMGQILHSVDDSLLEKWDEWSQQSSKYKPGECQRKWKTFDKGGGAGLGTLIATAKKHGYVETEDERVMPFTPEEIEQQANLLLETMEDEKQKATDMSSYVGGREDIFEPVNDKKRQGTRRSNKPSPNEIAEMLLTM